MQLNTFAHAWRLNKDSKLIARLLDYSDLQTIFIIHGKSSCVSHQLELSLNVVITIYVCGTMHVHGHSLLFYSNNVSNS